MLWIREHHEGMHVFGVTVAAPQAFELPRERRNHLPSAMPVTWVMTPMKDLPKLADNVYYCHHLLLHFIWLQVEMQDFKLDIQWFAFNCQSICQRTSENHQHAAVTSFLSLTILLCKLFANCLLPLLLLSRWHTTEINHQTHAELWWNLKRHKVLKSLWTDTHVTHVRPAIAFAAGQEASVPSMPFWRHWREGLMQLGSLDGVGLKGLFAKLVSKLLKTYVVWFDSVCTYNMYVYIYICTYV